MLRRRPSVCPACASQQTCACITKARAIWMLFEATPPFMVEAVVDHQPTVEPYLAAQYLATW